MNKYKTIFISALILLMLPSIAFSEEEHESWKNLPLTKDLKNYPVTSKIRLPNGHVLEIIQDTIFKKPGRKELTIDFSNYDKYKKAILRLTSNKGNVLDLKELERPIAKFVKNVICPGSTFYLLEVDYSAGMGSYNGPIAFMLEIKEDKISFVQAEDKGQMKELTLMVSLKTGWWPTAKKGSKCHDVLKLACRPDFDKHDKNNRKEMEFMLSYSRYHFDGRKWIVSRKEESGFWEYEDSDSKPDEALFPKAVP